MSEAWAAVRDVLTSPIATLAASLAWVPWWLLWRIERRRREEANHG